MTRTRAKEFVSEWQIGNADATGWLDLALQADSPEAEAVVVACSGIRVNDIVEEFESRQGKPLVAAPAAVMRRALRLAGLATHIRGKGTLLSQY